MIKVLFVQKRRHYLWEGHDRNKHLGRRRFFFSSIKFFICFSNFLVINLYPFVFWSSWHYARPMREISVNAIHLLSWAYLEYQFMIMNSAVRSLVCCPSALSSLCHLEWFQMKCDCFSNLGIYLFGESMLASDKMLSKAQHFSFKISGEDDLSLVNSFK